MLVNPYPRRHDSLFIRGGKPSVGAVDVFFHSLRVSCVSFFRNRKQILLGDVHLSLIG